MQLQTISKGILDNNPAAFKEPKKTPNAKILSIDINLAPFFNQRINIEFPFTPVVETSKSFFLTAYEQFPETVTASTAWFALNMVKSPLSIELIPVLTAGFGALVGASVSYLVRHLTGEMPVKLAITSEYLQTFISSKAFLAATGSAAAIGVITTLPAIMINSTPYLIGGVLTHHALNYLHEKQMIDQCLKSTLQKATVAVSSFFALQSPISIVSTFVMGAAVGSVMESQNAIKKNEQ